MGAEGGFIGIKLRGHAIVADRRGMGRDVPITIKSARVEHGALVIPSGLLEWCEGSNESTYREMVFEPEYLYGTWGSFQRWDLGDLPAFVWEASEYASLHAGATFADWIEDLYTHPWPDVDHGGFSGFLCDEYMGACWNQHGRPQLESPNWRTDDAFPGLVIAEWIAAVEAVFDLGDIDRMETWT